MTATNTFENELLLLIFNGTTIDGIAENDSSSPVTSYWISLHTADPGEDGSQTTSETTYGGYARVEVTRNGGGWSVTGNEASNVAEVLFGQCTAGTPTLTHVGLGTGDTGPGRLLLRNALNSSLVMQAGATPLFSPGELKFTAD